jgi:hypothetical protein
MVKSRILILILSLLTLAVGASGQAPSALETDPKGWIDISPKASFKGWVRAELPPGKTLDPVTQWKVDRATRTLICEGNRGHEWLRYDRELANFIVHVEWRFTKKEGLKGYNSGVIVRTTPNSSIWHQAQMGAENDAFLFGGKFINGEAQGLKFRPKPKENRIKPAGEWNTYEVRCEGPKITLWVNGAVTSEDENPDPAKGYLGLEAEGFRVEFRNLKLKVLPQN